MSMEQTGETLDFDGEKYVTSARAGKLVGYTKDYVGQLARAGKVKARLIGRSWYVSEDSIRAHKLETHYVLTKPKKHIENEIVSNDDKPSKNIAFSDKNVSSTLPLIQKNVSTQTHVAVGHAHALRELAHADVRFEGGQALVFDDAHVSLITKDKQTQTESKTTPPSPVVRDAGAILEQHSVEDVIQKHTHISHNDEYPVSLHVAREEKKEMPISPRKYVLHTSSHVPNMLAGVDGVVPSERTERMVAPLRTVRDTTSYQKQSTQTSIPPRYVDISKSSVSLAPSTKKILSPTPVSTQVGYERSFHREVSEKRIPVLAGFLSIILFSILYFIF